MVKNPKLAGTRLTSWLINGVAGELNSGLQSNILKFESKNQNRSGLMKVVTARKQNFSALFIAILL